MNEDLPYQPASPFSEGRFLCWGQGLLLPVPECHLAVSVASVLQREGGEGGNCAVLGRGIPFRVARPGFRCRRWALRFLGLGLGFLWLDFGRPEGFEGVELALEGL